MLDDPWVTVEQIAGHLQTTEGTVRRWLRAGTLLGRNFGDKMGWRVRRSALEAFLREDSGEALALAANQSVI